ncbi:hypothetical protein DDB_G0274883 [Dictyostelium discoideum AX4]|uniref:Fungal lipase-type domain-containing protein n=1 Tax=Dictyostelium discoideum TaxID=44689 RepID=Q555H1_DICDI|nr:hypothetical protein DDB_G0274883 [Dictyostelium discoideum AX4]EAL70334.1 hypothetical protein DDB_G0274883 [Dictyostelium discoideum AX4]|eukprot:XP_644098.1 hypothetical protein DDB_G0274883 [Dictyostelium discoideum AX4]
MLNFKITLLLFINLIILAIINCSIIKKEGDFLFAYFSDTVYGPITGNEYLQLNEKCMEWEIIIDSSGMDIWKSKFSNTVVVSFKGTSSIEDIKADLDIKYSNCNLIVNNDLWGGGGSGRGGGCGKIRNGFQEKYNEISLLLLSTIKKLDQQYDIYFTGHSLGGSTALLASLDYVTNHKDLNIIHSINCITFGQPSIGDFEFNKFANLKLDKFQYRRYININNIAQLNNNKTIEDPVVNFLSVPHPNNSPILLDCNNDCPNYSLGLHFLDLYKDKLYNDKYSKCNSNCNFLFQNPKITKKQVYHCPSSSESTIKGHFYPGSGFFTDKYSVCIFTNKDDFNKYEYSQNNICGGKSNILIDKTTNAMEFEMTVSGSDLFIIVENHNLFFSTSTLAFNISFISTIQVPQPPNNLTCKIISTNENSMDISVSFKSNNTISLIQPTMKYNIYLSEIGKDWIKYEFVEPLSKIELNEIIKNLKKDGLYSIVSTSDNGIESKTSNYCFVNGLDNKNKII